jgi:PAS domain S-box-containing protein
MEQFRAAKRYQYFIVGILVFLGLYLTSLYSYLLFHSLAEIFSIVIACGIFMIVWNSRRFLDNNYLIFIGIAYLFVGAVDLIHTLAYKGMGVFQGYETNLATQLWIATRYVQSLSLFIAPLFFRRKLKINLVFLGYTAVTSLLFISIFYWDIFPICFVEGVGLTPFKKISEYIISSILLASIIPLLKNRREFDRDVLQLLVCSIILTIISESAFTFYINAYGLSNLIGHFFEILAFYFIYKAIIQTGLTKPYDLLFRNLKRSEVLFREEKNRIQSYLDIAGVILVVIDANQKVSLINKKGCEILGYEENEIIGKNWFDTFIPERIREEVKAGFRKLMDGEIDPVEYFENPVLTKTGVERMIAWHNAVLRDEKGNIVNRLSSGEDITERKKMGEEIAHLASFPRLNPSPVVEIDLSGCIHYINPAAELLFPDLRSAGIKHPWFGDFESMAAMFQTGHETFYSREIKINNNYYHQTITSIPKSDRIRTYGFDITGRKQVEEALRKSRDELEIRVQERTTELANAYKELKEQSRILESFFKYTVTPLVFLDRDFNFIRVNEAYAKACQRDISEFPGHNHFEFYPSDAKAKFQQAVQTKEPYVAIAKPFTFPDHPEWGPTYWNWTLTPLLDDRGEVEFLVFSLEDVTERKRTETQLKAASLYARSLIEASLDPLVTINRDGKIMDVNRATELVAGVLREQLIGSDFSNYFTEPEKAREGYRQVFETGSVRDYPLAIRHTAGRVTEVLYNATTYKNKAGEVQGIFAAARDITERKRAEEALQAASLYTRSLIEANLDPLVTISTDGKVMDVNKATELVTGVNREELIGSDFSDYFTEPEKAREGYQQVFKMGSVRDYPLSIRHTSGRITDVLYHATPYRNETGEVQGIFAAARDITERKRAEEALKESENRLRALSSQLLTVQENERKRIALEIHDGIGQILTAIKFKVEDITQQMSKGKAIVKEKSLETIIPLIQESIEEVRRIQMDLRPSTLDDLGILATTDWFCREFEKIYSTIHIEKLINIHENEVPAHLRTAIFRVMQEALNNIAKHSKADLVHLSLQKTDGTIELAILDNGQGFNLMEVLSVEGSKRGLGLTSMRERTELSGGSFVVESTRGRGTVIRALWPTG